MSDLVDKLLQKSKSKLIAMWVLSEVFLVVVIYFVFISASTAAIEETEKKAHTLQSEVLDLRSKFKRLNSLKAMMVKLEKRISEAEEELPEKEEMPKLLSTLSGLAKGSGLDIQVWRPEAERMSDYYVEIPISIEVKGTFHQLATFFDEVGRLDRIVNIINIAMSEPDVQAAGTVRLKTECTAITFRQLTELEKKEKEELEEKQKGKRR